MHDRDSIRGEGKAVRARDNEKETEKKVTHCNKVHTILKPSYQKQVRNKSRTNKELLSKSEPSTALKIMISYVRTHC